MSKKFHMNWIWIGWAVFILVFHFYNVQRFILEFRENSAQPDRLIWSHSLTAGYNEWPFELIVNVPLRVLFFMKGFHISFIINNTKSGPLFHDFILRHTINSLFLLCPLMSHLLHFVKSLSFFKPVLIL